MIRDARALYPEYEFQEPYGLHRPGVNIGSLIFLYRQVVAYVPPITRNQFVERFGVDYESFLELAYPNDPTEKFVFPVLNHPNKYRKNIFRTELYEILIRMPPTWERWHSALDETGGNRWFDESDERFNYEAIWSIPDLRDIWKSKLRTDNESVVSSEIKQQVRNNYTDLCLVGRSELANEIAELSKTDAEASINELLYASDLYAYHSVMGAGGNANVRASQSGRVVPHKQVRIAELFPQGEYFDTDVLEALFEGLKFHAIPQVFRLEFLKSWHRSDNAERAREAYGTILDVAKSRNPSLEDLHRTIKGILIELDEFCRHAEPSHAEADKIAQTRNNTIVRITAAGGIVSTVIGLFTFDVFMAIAGGLFTVVGAKTWESRDRIVRRLLQRHAPNIPEHLYRKYKELNTFTEDFWKEVVRECKPRDEPDYRNATSIPVRTVWWTTGSTE